MNAEIKTVGSASAAAHVSAIVSDGSVRNAWSASAPQDNAPLVSPPARDVPSSPAVAAPAAKVVAVESGGVLQFSVEPETSQLVIKIVNGTTSEVIRKIPTDQIEDVLSQVRGVPGLIVNQTS